MKKIGKLTGQLLVAVMAVGMAGCQYLGVPKDISGYVETAQEGAADNEELKTYLEGVRPVLEAFYAEKGKLETAEVKGNEIRITVDPGTSPDPYKSFEDLLVFETTRITHSIYNYRPDHAALKGLYRIVISFTGQKTVTLYDGQSTTINGAKGFDAATVLDAVRR